MPGKPSRTFAVAIATLLVAGTASVKADTVYDNSGSLNGLTSCCFGTPNTTTVGETFLAPSDGNTNLNSFSLFLSPNSGSIQFAAYIATWNSGSNEIGSVLFSSDQVTYNQNGTQEFAFAPGVNLTAGGDYVAFLSITTGFSTQVITAAKSPLAPAGSIPGGLFVFQNNSGNFSSLSTTAWGNLGFSDEFKADFSPPPVPEPSSLVLFGSCLIGSIGAMCRKFSKLLGSRSV